MPMPVTAASRPPSSKVVSLDLDARSVGLNRETLPDTAYLQYTSGSTRARRPA